MILDSRSMYGYSDTLNFLESMEYLDYHESYYDPTMVNIIYNQRFDKDLIKLESFIEYADSNDIDDGGYAISKVCQENQVLLNNIGFVVEEASVLADDNVFNTAKQLRENGYMVVVEPMSKESYYYQSLDEAMTLDEGKDFERSYNLIAFCEKFDPIGKAKEVGKSIGNKISSRYNQIKDTFSEAPKNLAKKLSAIKAMIADKNKKLRTAAGDAKVAIKNQISKLKKAFDVVKDKLVSAKDSAVKAVGNAKDTVVSKAKSAGEWVSDKASAAKKKVAGVFS